MKTEPKESALRILSGTLVTTLVLSSLSYGETGRQLSSGQVVSLGLTNFRYRTRETWFPKWSPKSKDAIQVRTQSIPKRQEGGETQLLLAIRHRRGRSVALRKTPKFPLGVMGSSVLSP